MFLGIWSGLRVHVNNFQNDNRYLFQLYGSRVNQVRARQSAEQRVLLLDNSRLNVVISGYGHIAPSTSTGKLITIVYAIFGIPIFLILLADFGKMFTRGIKFIWAFVRRLYYTGSCRKVRRTAPVQVSVCK